MRKLVPVAIAIAAMASASVALAEPIQISDDENYSRLARWEQHLDDRIANGVANHSLRGSDAWRLQKRLDGIEIHLVRDTYQSSDGLSDAAARGYADQLRALGRDLGERTDWEGYSDRRDGGPDYGPPPPPPPSNYSYYREGDYEADCRRGNRAAGTVFGAIASGLIGGAVSHGNGGAVVGGVVLGGLAGNAIAGDIDCDDQHYAFARYNEALNGPVGTEMRWEHNGRWGTFRSVREFQDGPYICREFRTVNYRNGQRFERDGTACREADGYWHFR
ncbi:MAG: hypothetical protein JOZ55_02465 [Alphaproteobacteria bacterium]|nr:hypothetical protein [Alphaproteobacteria bacterium]